MKFLFLLLPLLWMQLVESHYKELNAQGNSMVFRWTTPRLPLDLPQDSWTVCFNNKTVISAKAEDAAGTRLQVSVQELRKKSSLKVVYTEDPKKDTWERFIMIVDPKDKELLKVKGNTLSITNARLASLLKNGKTLRIFTWSLPKDPEERARVRVRRVLLCSVMQTPLISQR